MSFPQSLNLFLFFLALTDGLGTGRVRLVVGQPEKDEIVYQREGRVHFPDKVTEVYLHFRVRECEFPEPGLYQFTLLVDNEWVA
jgi:hypothetical protein